MHTLSHPGIPTGIFEKTVTVTHLGVTRENGDRGGETTPGTSNNHPPIVQHHRESGKGVRPAFSADAFPFLHVTLLNHLYSDKEN